VHVDAYEFGRITIDGVVYDHDVVIEAGEIRKRRKGPSKPRREEFGHTPLTVEEEIPWTGKRLWIGTGASGLLPVAEELRREARRRGIDLLVATTPVLVERINRGLPAGTSLILHVTC
jgi:hypothetical protein